jgi:CO/xanthine dehydrogenase Mo-binding subunit
VPMPGTMPRGLVVGAAVHGFNRWQWAQADFTVDGVSVHVPVDALSVRYGDGAGARKRALATTPNQYQVLDRRTVSFPPTRNNNAMVGYNSAVGTLAELAVDATSGKVTLLTHHTILECGNMLVPELVSGQIQGGVASGIGLALHEELPLYEDGPGDGTWNFNRYHLPRGSDVAVLRMIGGLGTGIVLNDWPTHSPATIRGTSDRKPRALARRRPERRSSAG